jgi:hypothetical protein
MAVSDKAQHDHDWRRATCCAAGECAELASDNEEILIRSSREPGIVVRLTRAEWSALAQGIGAGDFDTL